MLRYWIFFHGKNLALVKGGGQEAELYGFSGGVAVFAPDAEGAKTRAARRFFRGLARKFGEAALASAELRPDSVYRIPWYSRWLTTETIMLIEGNPDFDDRSGAESA